MRLSLTKVLPRHPQSSPPPGRAGGATMEGDEQSQFVWDALVPRSIQPLTVAVVEALLWLESPLSAPELGAVFSGEFSFSSVSYHLTKLAVAETIAEVGERWEDGAAQPLYFFPDQERQRDIGALESA
jgi:hypothetical protein